MLEPVAAHPPDPVALWIRHWQAKFQRLARSRVPYDRDFAMAVSELHAWRTRVCWWALHETEAPRTSCAIEPASSFITDPDLKFCPYCGSPVRLTHAHDVI